MEYPWRRKNLLDVWKWPHLFWFQLYGWWAEDIKNKWRRKIMMVMRYPMYAINIWFNIAVIIQIVIDVGGGNIMDNIFMFFSALPAIVGLAKIYTFVRNRDALKKAMGLIDEMMLNAVHLGLDSAAENQIRMGYAKCWIIFYASLLSGIATNVHWIFGPAINLLHGEKSTILATWPVAYDTWPLFCFTYIYQTMNILTLGLGLYSFDNFFFCMGENILIQLKILRHRLYILNISQRDAGTNLNINLKSCIQHYDNILRVCRILSSSSTGVLYIQCFQTVLILCSGVYTLTGKGIPSAAMLLPLLELIFTILLILYFYCWYCCEITYQCGDVLNSAYMSDWTFAETKDRKDLTILMTRTMMPVKFGGILQVDLNTFISIMKTTFSYYNFLKAVDSTKTNT